MQLVRQALELSLVEKLFAAVDDKYRALRGEGPPAQLSGRFVVTASSFRIEEFWSPAAIRESLIPAIAPVCRSQMQAMFDSPLACNYDQSWIRRQYAPVNYPPHHAPHGWHQDGALGFDFLAHGAGPYPAAALLNMVTCWIPFTPCGVDAPGLELVTQPQPALLAPAELTEPGIRERFVIEKFWRPVMKPGDALLFRGDILHRTHVLPTMTHDRTSVELRFFPADHLPSRLRSDSFLCWK